MEEMKPRYLGDGVYASFDGYHVNLHVGSHDSPRVVALEPKVLARLHDYEDDIAGFILESTTPLPEDKEIDPDNQAGET